MPVSNTTYTAIHEASQRADSSIETLTQLAKEIPVLDISLFEDIKKLITDIKRYEEDERESRRKIEKYKACIRDAEEMIAKAQSKKDTLQKKNDFLRGRLDEQEMRKREALKYWEDWGIDVKQISTEQSDFEQYEFIYKNLHGQQCTVNLKLHNKRLEVLDLVPELLPADKINELNERLTSNCVHSNGLVDYKSALIMIKRAITDASSRQTTQNGDNRSQTSDNAKH